MNECVFNEDPQTSETLAGRLFTADHPSSAPEFSGVDEFSLTADAKAGLRELRSHLPASPGVSGQEDPS